MCRSKSSIGRSVAPSLQSVLNGNDRHETVSPRCGIVSQSVPSSETIHSTRLVRVEPDTIIVQNPTSGSGNHIDEVRKRAELGEYDLVLTEEAGDGASLAEQAVTDGYDTIVAGGGDGTVNEVLRGIDEAGALSEVALGILPLGTGNNFAEQIGVTDIDSAFDVIDRGERRKIDVGRANGRPFLNSCIAGITAESSTETSIEAKSRLGVLAYVQTTLQSITEFESPHLVVDGDGENDWSGRALCALVGNGRRFAIGGRSQAHMEDGLFDVTVIENPISTDAIGETIIEEVLGEDRSSVVRFRTHSLKITNLDTGTVRFSLDGEIVDEKSVSLETNQQRLSVAVGEEYDCRPTHST